MPSGQLNRIVIYILFLLICAPPLLCVDDSVQVSAGKSDIDTIIVVSATDSVHFNVKRKTMRLRGGAVVTFKQQIIEAEVINMDFASSTLTAEGAQDSTGKIAGFPVFKDKGEEFAGESMIYNFTTGRGRVKFGETSIEGGFYYGSRIKRTDEKTAFVEDGCFTTCDAPRPHFFFNSPKMKVIADDKVFLDPTIVYVEDIPLFALPIGLFFDARKGRRSGFIMPNPLVTNNRGIVLQNIGYYYAANDYFDTQLTADLLSKGGFTAYSESQYVIRDRLNGRAKITFGYTRLNVEDPFARNFAFDAKHQQQLGPNESIAADLLFTSQKVYQNTSFNPIDRIRQNARSNASYQRTFYNGMTFNVGFTRDQNMSNGSVNSVPSASFGIPQMYPLRGIIGGESWMRDLTFVYRATGRYAYSSQRSSDTGNFVVTENSVIEHRPGITVTPKLGNFTFQPTVSYSENWWFQRYTKSIDTTDSVAKEVSVREPGFFREYTYSYGVSASTFLYGMIYPNILGISAFRHTLQPIVGFQYMPDQSDPSNDFYAEYIGATGKTVRYNRFGSGSIASSSKKYLVNMGLTNKFSIKPTQADSDTVAAKPIDLVTFNINSSYNLAADSMKLSPLRFDLRTPVLKAISFNLTGTFNPYDQAKVENESTGRLEWRDIGTSMIEAGKGLGRFTNLAIQVGTSFSSAGVSFERSTIVTDSVKKDSTKEDLRSRFSRRLNLREQEVDLFADHTPGWSPVIVPWEVSLDFTYNYSKPTPDLLTQTLQMRFRGSATLTQTLSLNATGVVDVLKFKLSTPIIDITKRIHCWNLTLNWVPLGPNQGFYLRFSAAAPQLRGAEFVKQNTPVYR
ncbi:MAG: LPS-assembly protein LptD [Ignavibacteria bacterium]|nr:LPS-assembly protein LptD [Ignavibacteria bacterium]